MFLLLHNSRLVTPLSCGIKHATAQPSSGDFISSRLDLDVQWLQRFVGVEINSISILHAQMDKKKQSIETDISLMTLLA